MVVPRYFLLQEPPLPADMVGVPSISILPARSNRLWSGVRRAQRLVVVTGASASDRLWETELRDVASHFKDRVTVEFLVGLPTSAVLKRLGQLGDDAVVFTPGYFQDGEGRSFIPRESARTHGDGRDGPRVRAVQHFYGHRHRRRRPPNYRAIGRQAGVAVGRLLNGETPASLNLPEVRHGTLTVDWRQLRRWGISESSVTERHNRTVQATNLVGDDIPRGDRNRHCVLASEWFGHRVNHRAPTSPPC